MSAVAVESHVSTSRHRYAPQTFSAGVLDQREWHGDGDVRFALGHRFRLRSSSEALAQEANRALVDLRHCFVRPAPEVAVVLYSLIDRGEARDLRRRFALYADDERVGFARSGERLLGFLLWHLNQRAVASIAESHLVLHAAAAERDGILVVMAAPEAHGKTTTVAGLLRHGFRYVTDEAVAIDRKSLAVTPYPKPLSVGRGSWGVLSDLGAGRDWPPETSWQLPASEISALSDGKGPSLFISPRYEQGALTALRPVSRGQMLLMLAGCSFALAPGTAEATLGLLATLVSGTTCYELTIGDLAEAVAAVEGLLSQT
jgi:hypothetical protein